MFSMPPAMTTSESPARISAAASMIAFSPEPQTRLIVVADVVSGSPSQSRVDAAQSLPLPEDLPNAVELRDKSAELTKAFPKDQKNPSIGDIVTINTAHVEYESATRQRGCVPSGDATATRRGSAGSDEVDAQGGGEGEECAPERDNAFHETS